MSPSGFCLLCFRPLPAPSDTGLCTACIPASAGPGRAVTPLPTPTEVIRRGAAWSRPPTRPEPQATLTLGRAIRSAEHRLPKAPPGYELVRWLGGGGMGDVYLAWEGAAERTVAMKFLRGTASPDAVDRFGVEVRALARLDHPGIVRVLAVDMDRHDPLFTMEYVPGGTLADRVKAVGPLPPAEAARLIGAVARAVHAAHGAGVLHRDLKPSNILLTADGTPKVTDFGLAKRTDADDGLTLGAGPLGTPSYMPPEQVSPRHGPVGPASDVYGLGATLYQLLTGHPPFQGDSSPEIMSLVETTPPPRPRSVRPDIPADLEGVVVKCLEKDPAGRYASAADLADDLGRFLAGQKPTAPPLTRWRRAKRWAGRNRQQITVAVALGVAAAAGAVALFPPQPVPAKTEAETVAEIRRELAAGRPVVLVGETGRPRYHRWVMDPGEFVDPGDGTFGFLNRMETLLELLPDPGIDRYRLSVEVRQLESASQRDGSRIAGYQVGIYFGYDLQTDPDGTKVHSFSSVEAADYQPNPPKPLPPEITYHDHLVVIPRLMGRGGVSRDIVHTPCERVEKLPGPWRRFEAELTPEHMRVDFGLPSRGPVGHDAAGIRDRVTTLQTHLTTPPLNRFVRGVQLPPWSTRRPFGLRVLGASIAVRNVVITPIPSPES